MSRYLSFLRKKVHGGHDDPVGAIGGDKKRKNHRHAPLNGGIHGNPVEEMYHDNDSLLDTGSLAESDDSHLSGVVGELKPNPGVHDMDDSLDDQGVDNDIDDVINKAFSDLEIGLLTDRLTGTQDGVGDLEANQVEATLSRAITEDDVVIITETTEEEIVEVDVPFNVEDGNKQSLVTESSRDSVDNNNISKNEFTIKILVPSQNDASQNVRSAASCDFAVNKERTPIISVNQNNVATIQTSKSFHIFPASNYDCQPLRHSKSCQFISSDFATSQSCAKKRCKNLSTNGTSSEEDFDSAKETLSDDDFGNVTRIYIQQTDGVTPNLALDQIDCSVAIDTGSSDGSEINHKKVTDHIDELSIKLDSGFLSDPSASTTCEANPEESVSEISLNQTISQNLDDQWSIQTVVLESELVEENCTLETMGSLSNGKSPEEHNKSPVEETFPTDSSQSKGGTCQPTHELLDKGEPDLSQEVQTPEKNDDTETESLLDLDKSIDEEFVKLDKELSENNDNCEDDSMPKINKDCLESTTNDILIPHVEETPPQEASEESASHPIEEVQNGLPLVSKPSTSDEDPNANQAENVSDNLTTARFDARKAHEKNDVSFLTSNKCVGGKEDILQNVLVTSVCMDHDKAEARLAQRRAARVEAREMRLKELEKHQPEEDEENDDEKQYVANDSTGMDGFPVPDKAVDNDKRKKKNSQRLQSPANSKTPSRPTRSSVGRSSLSQLSRRSSEDSIPDEALPAFAKELKSELKEMEEKFRKAMITNAQLDNEKATLTYEVEFLKDKFTELEELHVQLTKEHRHKCSENEQLRKLSNKLRDEMKMLRKILQEREELIQEYGLVVVGEEENGEGSGSEDDEMTDETINSLSPRKIAIKKALLSQEAADLLSRGAANGSLDVRLKRYAEEKLELEDEVRRLKMELEEEVHRRRKENGLDSEKQRETSTYINDYKLRVQKSEAEVSTLQANVARLESLVTRYKAQSEELEKSEEELKTERRKILRELREAQTRLEETELINSHLQKRFDKLKTARSTLLKDLSLDPT